MNQSIDKQVEDLEFLEISNTFWTAMNVQNLEKKCNYLRMNSRIFFTILYQVLYPKIILH